MPQITTTMMIVAAGVLVYVSITDIRERRIPNAVMFPSLVLALVVALVSQQRWMLLLGGLVAGGFLLLPTLIYGLNKAGGGDVKLGLFIGLVLGWPAVLPALMVAFLTAGAFAVAGLLLRRVSIKGTIAFGPFLALGALVVGALNLLLA